MRDLIKGTICAVVAVLFFSFMVARLHAQVEIQQSQSSSVNGVQTETEIKTENGKTEIKTDHGTLILVGDHLKYCAQKCGPNYTLWANGTVSFP